MAPLYINVARESSNLQTGKPTQHDQQDSDHGYRYAEHKQITTNCRQSVGHRLAIDRGTYSRGFAKHLCNSSTNVRRALDDVDPCLLEG